MCQFLVSHTAPVLFVAIFAEQVGIPVPAAPLLVAAGAMSAEGALNPLLALAVTLAACVLPDLVWFYIGRRNGISVFRFLRRRFPRSSERTEAVFAKYGMLAVIGSKFIPGLSLLIPLLGGALKIDLRKFLKFDVLGSLLYGIFYLELGFLFSDQVNTLLDLLNQFGAALLVAATALILIFLACKYVLRRKATKTAADAAPSAAAATIPAT